MTTESKGIYHWNLGDVALARMCQKVYTRVRVIKDEKGLFFDDKVLGITSNEDGSLNITEELCYFVETCRTNEKLWLPYTCMHLTERSRPFYGAEKVSPGKVETVPSPKSTPKKIQLKDDHILPLQVKLNTSKPDINTAYDIQNVPSKNGKYENAFKEFVRLGKEQLFDHYFEILQLNFDEHMQTLTFLMSANASTEDKLELLVKKNVSENELNNYLKQCWRYNYVKDEVEEVHTDSQEISSDVSLELLVKKNVSENELNNYLKQCWRYNYVKDEVEEVHTDSQEISSDVSDNEEPSPPPKLEVTVHIPWCLVCGKADKLQTCTNCAASYHQACMKNWLNTIVHRKKTPEKTIQPVVMVEKIMSSTRTKSSLQFGDENVGLCPSCQWGPIVGYDDVVWHKLGSCPWWPARVLTPGEVPACLRAKDHCPDDWPLRYYGTLNHGWGARCRMCLFLPSHTAQLEAREEGLKDAVMDASDAYITVYLT